MPSYSERYKNACPTTSESLKTHLASNPAEGMPYGLPSIEQEQIDEINKWLAAGSKGPSAENQEKALALANPTIVARWEAFFQCAG